MARYRYKFRRRARPKKLKQPAQFKYRADTRAARQAGEGRRQYRGWVLQKAFVAFSHVIMADQRRHLRQKKNAELYRRLRSRDHRSKAYKKWKKRWDAYWRSRRVSRFR